MSCLRATRAAQLRAARALPRASNWLKRPGAWPVVFCCTGVILAHQLQEGVPQGNSLDSPGRRHESQQAKRDPAEPYRWHATGCGHNIAKFVGLLLLCGGCRGNTTTFARRRACPSKPVATVACVARRGHESDASVEIMEMDTPVIQQIASEEDTDHDKAVILLGTLGALAFCSYVTVTRGTNAGAEWLSCYLIEYTLSVDNLFLFVVIFKYFELHKDHQRRVLNFGIAGAILLRLLFVYLGTELLQQVNSLILGFAAILIYASISGLLKSVEHGEEVGMKNNPILQNIGKFIDGSPQLDGDKFFTQANGKTVATPLFLCLLVLELSDVVFATDSVPAIRGTTHDPFIAYTSSIFAVFGMRSLFFLLQDAMVEFFYLEPAINLVLGFIGLKIVVEYFEIASIPTLWSLGAVLTILTGGVIFSIQKAAKPKR